MALLVAPVAFADEKAEDKSKDSEKKTTANAADKSVRVEKTPINTNDSPLVRAAKNSSKEREKSRLSITNDDLKNIEGTLIETSEKPLAPLPPARNVEAALLHSTKNENKGRKEATAKVATLQKEVDDLEKELRRIEETYYNEDDPDYREEVISMRFEETKKQLNTARDELAKARRGVRVD